MVSASTGAGIGSLFRSLCKSASLKATPSPNESSEYLFRFEVPGLTIGSCVGVREHVNAAALRMQHTRVEKPSSIKISNRVRNKIK